MYTYIVYVMVDDRSFKSGTLEPIELEGPRRRGRPRATWSQIVHKEALKAAGSHNNLLFYCSNARHSVSRWRKAVRDYCRGT